MLDEDGTEGAGAAPAGVDPDPVFDAWPNIETGPKYPFPRYKANPDCLVSPPLACTVFTGEDLPIADVTVSDMLSTRTMMAARNRVRTRSHCTFIVQETAECSPLLPKLLPSSRYCVDTIYIIYIYDGVLLLLYIL